MLRRPATGFSKNCVPKREKQKSCTGWNEWVCTSAARKVTLPIPAARASRRPYSRKPSQQSTASTEPVGPTRRASSIAVSPKPQPASITLSPLLTCNDGKIFSL